MSGLERPSLASWAICASCGVRTSLVSSAAPARSFPGGQQLTPRAIGERLGSDAVERAVGGAQVFTRIHAAVEAAKPFAVDELGSALIRSKATVSQSLDSLLVERFGRGAVRQQRARACLEAEGPIRAACSRSLAEALQGRLGDRWLVAAYRCLNELCQREGVTGRGRLARMLAPPRGVPLRIGRGRSRAARLRTRSCSGPWPGPWRSRLEGSSHSPCTKTTGVAAVAFARSICSSSCSVIGIGETVVLISASSVDFGARLDDRRRGRSLWIRTGVGGFSRSQDPADGMSSHPPRRQRESLVSAR